MSEQVTNSTSGRRLPKVFIYGAVAAVLVLLVGGGLLIFRAREARPSATMGSNLAIEERWGVRVKQIGVTADGGMVDFRFVVLDADKAVEMMKDVNNLPVLIAEDSQTVVNSAAAMAVTHDLRVGQTYFLLYRNTRGAVKSGTPVTVKFGDLQILHAPAQ